jgi:AraC-like DNA-binding protein
MDDRFRELYNIVLMRSFRAVFDESPHKAHERFRVDVLGYRQRFRVPVNVPSGNFFWFAFMFYERISVVAADGPHTPAGPSLIVCDPRTPLIHGLPRGAWRRSWLRFGGTEVRSILDECGVPLRRVLTFDSHEENEHRLLEIYDELTHPRGANDQTLFDLFRIWMRSVARGSSTGAAVRVPAAFRVARSLIEERWQEPFSLSEIAEACHISRSYLCKGFRKYYGTSPASHMIDLKLAHAKELLRDVDLNITEVADECGFSDIFYFSRTFKKRVGVSPKAYRDAAGRNDDV